MSLAVVKYFFKTNDSRDLSKISFGPFIEEKIDSIVRLQNAKFIAQLTKQLENETKSLGVMIHNEFSEIMESELKSFLNELKAANFKTFENLTNDSL